MNDEVDKFKQDHPTFWKRARVALIALGVGIVIGLGIGYKVAHAATAELTVPAKVTASCDGAVVPASVNGVITCGPSSGGGGGGTPPPSTDPFAGCPASYALHDPGWSINWRIALEPGKPHVFVLRTGAAGATVNMQQSNWDVYPALGTGGPYRYSVSHVPCDFGAANAVRYATYDGRQTANPLIGTSFSSVFSFYYGIVVGDKGNLLPNNTYYFNMIPASDCGASQGYGTCGAVGTLRRP